VYTSLLVIARNILPLLQPNVGRYTTGVWTRQYLEQQLRMVLAGRAAEELVYGIDEMSSLHQHKIMQARQVRRVLQLV
jgi:ATP-dependent Zn protease